MKLSPAPTVSTTSTRGAGTSIRSLPSMATDAALAECRDTKSRARLCPGGEALLKAAARVKPFEILLAPLDDVSLRHVAFDQRSDRLAVRGDERPDIGIEAHGGARGRKPNRFDHRLSVAFHSGEGSDVQVSRRIRPFGRKRPRPVVSCSVEVEGIAGAGLGGPAHDEGERRRAHVARDEAQVDPIRREGGGERFAIRVRGKARDEGGRRAKPSQPNRDVVGRAAQDGVIGIGLDRVGDEVDQRLAGDHDHGRYRPAEPRLARLTAACKRSSRSYKIPPRSVLVRVGRGSKPYGRRTARDSRRRPSAG